MEMVLEDTNLELVSLNQRDNQLRAQSHISGIIATRQGGREESGF